MGDDAREGLPVKHNKVITVNGVRHKAAKLLGLASRPLLCWYNDQQGKELGRLGDLQLLPDSLQGVGSMLIVADKENGTRE
jgi:hypothetical protein